jgi:hypothetical protein
MALISEARLSGQTPYLIDHRTSAKGFHVSCEGLNNGTDGVE